MPTSQNSILDSCPPSEFTFHYSGELELPGRQRKFFRCGMYLMLDYEGQDDSIELFQDLFRPYLESQSIDKDALFIIFDLVMKRLVSLDDDFYDLAIGRFFRDGISIGLSQEDIFHLEQFFKDLKNRGYSLPLTSLTPEGIRSMQ